MNVYFGYLKIYIQTSVMVGETVFSFLESYLSYNTGFFPVYSDLSTKLYPSHLSFRYINIFLFTNYLSSISAFTVILMTLPFMIVLSIPLTIIKGFDNHLFNTIQSHFKEYFRYNFFTDYVHKLPD